MLIDYSATLILPLFSRGNRVATCFRAGYFWRTLQQVVLMTVGFLAFWHDYAVVRIIRAYSYINRGEAKPRPRGVATSRYKEVVEREDRNERGREEGGGRVRTRDASPPQVV